MRVLVCGGRDFINLDALYKALDELHRDSPISVLIHGGAAGADVLAGQWARDRRVPVLCFPADWDTHGRAAGPVRNKQMLDEGLPDLVVAFPGGRGTANMTSQAVERGVNVLRMPVGSGASGQS